MAITVPDTKATWASVYKEAGDARYEEAKYLANDHSSGAIYLAGYLIECHLNQMGDLRTRLCQLSSGFAGSEIGKYADKRTGS